jgi:hypothetical protein
MPPYNQAYLDEQARMLASEQAPGGDSGSYESINWDKPSSYVDDIIGSYMGTGSSAGGDNSAQWWETLFTGEPAKKDDFSTEWLLEQGLGKILGSSGGGGGGGGGGINPLTALLGAVGGSYLNRNYGGANIAPAGYQGSIPEYTASRTPLALDDTDRRPGSGGRRYMSDVQYTPKDSAPAAPTVNRGQVPTQAPAQAPSGMPNAQMQQFYEFLQKNMGGNPSSNPTTPNREAPDATDPFIMEFPGPDGTYGTVNQRPPLTQTPSDGGGFFDISDEDMVKSIPLVPPYDNDPNSPTYGRGLIGYPEQKWEKPTDGGGHFNFDFIEENPVVGTRADGTETRMYDLDNPNRKQPPPDYQHPILRSEAPDAVAPPAPTGSALDSIMQMAVGILTPDMQYDFNGDGRITSNDALLYAKQSQPPPLDRGTFPRTIPVPTPDDGGMVRSQQFIDENNNKIDDRDEVKAAPVKSKADPVKLSAVQQNMLRQVQNMAKESGQNPAEVQRLTSIYGDMNAAKKPPVKTKAAPVKAAPVKAAPVKAAPKKPLARLPAKAPAPVKRTAVEELGRRRAEQPMFAQGGIANLGRGRYLSGQSDGMADAVSANIDGAQPAALSHGEYIIPADVVGHLGNGNSNAGAKALDDFLSSIRKQRTGNPKQGKQINAQKTLPEVPRV